jgi:hypothetical protein
VLSVNAEQFLKWAESSKLRSEVAEQLARHAPETEEYNNLYSLGGISQCFSKPPYSIRPTSDTGFMVIGSCSGGDQIVLNISDDYGAVYYLSHETIHSPPYKLAKVTSTLDEFMQLANAYEDPIDYYAARKRKTD